MRLPFGLAVALAAIADEDVTSGLRRFARPPQSLVAITDRVRLQADIERSIPEFASGALTLAWCRLRRERMEGGTWTAICRLTIDDPQEGGGLDVDLRATVRPAEADPPPSPGDGRGFPTPGWRGYLPDLRLDLSVEPDEALPALPSLTDPEGSRALLEGAFRESASGLADLQLAACTPTVMRYREGLRCTVRYLLEYPPERQSPHWPTGVVAKVYEGDEGRTTYDAMRALWASPLRTSTVVTIAEPLAILPEINVVLQRVVPGEAPLKDCIETAFAAGLQKGVDVLAPLVRKAGRGLAELHESHAALGRIVTWETRMAAVRGAADQLTAALPALAGAIDPLVAKLDASAREVPAGPLVPSHGSFRPAQILVDHDDIAFVDFDLCCQAEASVDLAIFRTTLYDLSLQALTKKGSRPLAPDEQQACFAGLDELCALFLAAYEEVGQVSRPRLALWDALTNVKDVLDCWRKLKFENLERRLGFLYRRLGMEPSRG